MSCESSGNHSFSEDMWQWLIDYTTIILDIIHCFRNFYTYNGLWYAYSAILGDFLYTGRYSIPFSDVYTMHRVQFIIQTNKCTTYTRWFKHDRDCLHLFTHKSVPVVFEPPCVYVYIQRKHYYMLQCICVIRESYTYILLKLQKLLRL